MPFELQQYLLYGADAEGANPYLIFYKGYPDMEGPSFETWFKANEDHLLSEYTKELPGRRPWSWWKWTAPELRRKLSGTGIPEWEDLNVSERHMDGIPGCFCKIDLNDLPVYESCASHLKRLGLLLPGEEKKIKPEDFKPRAILESELKPGIFAKEWGHYIFTPIE